VTATPRQPRVWSLFSTTAWILVGSVSFILVFALTAVIWFAMVPMAKRSADDLAALIVLSAQTWVELPKDAQPLLATELKNQHGLKIEEIQTLSRQHGTALPYVRFLHDAVVRRLNACPPGTTDPNTGECVYMGVLPDHAGYWLEVPMADDVLRFEFSRERVGYRIPFTLGIALVGGILLTLMLTLVVTRRLTRPVSLLAAQVRQGLPDAALPLTGPQETRVLIDAVNRRSAEVARLLENRTILLAGISHDLRTPLTRLSLGLELARDSIESALQTQMMADIEQMNRLISEVLQIARGVSQAEGVPIQLHAWLTRYVTAWRQRGTEISLVIDASSTALEIDVAQDSLQRILDNLVENAHRYGRPPITLRCLRWGDAQILCVEDEGQGLTAAEILRLREPFARKDEARSGVTGYGLGLSLALVLAEAQGWSLDLYAVGERPDPVEGAPPKGLMACLRLPEVSSPTRPIAAGSD
jgi:two-component system, OmpR family, osmolarity sensor histidine kinase EnvZ